MGGIRVGRLAAVRCGVAAALLLGVAAGCDDEPADDRAVNEADALLAIVEWQVGEQAPVLDDDGDALLPVVFVVADDGAMIDVGVQAEVAAATADWATVRFADDVADTFNPDIDGKPVRDEGTMLVVGPMPDSARQVEVDVVRFIAADESEPFVIQVTATPGPPDTSAVSPRAAVTSATSATLP